MRSLAEGRKHPTLRAALVSDERARGAQSDLVGPWRGLHVGGAFDAMCAARRVRHVLTRPAHPWTNGRIERLFKTLKETVARYVWLFASVRQVDRYCADFRLWYDRDRPHGSYGGRTPDEVFFGRDAQRRPLGRVSYFDGQLYSYRFGPAG